MTSAKIDASPFRSRGNLRKQFPRVGVAEAAPPRIDQKLPPTIATLTFPAAAVPIDEPAGRFDNESEHTGHAGETALHSAAFWGRDDIARLLLESGADVNARTDRQSIPLHDAARLTNVKMARLLLEHGANPEAKDEDGKTPLDWCRKLNWKNSPEIEKLFRPHPKKNGD